MAGILRGGVGRESQKQSAGCEVSIRIPAIDYGIMFGILGCGLWGLVLHPGCRAWGQVPNPGLPHVWSGLASRAATCGVTFGILAAAPRVALDILAAVCGVVCCMSLATSCGAQGRSRGVSPGALGRSASCH